MKLSILIATFLYSFIVIVMSADRITYMSVEHAVKTYVNPKYVNTTTSNFTAFRYGRKSLVYYVKVEFEALVWFGNDLEIHFYFYEFLSNTYKRSFVELHHRFCDFLHKDLIFGAAMRQGRLAGPCPFPPGIYRLTNMTVLPEAIPRGFPFTKGRIYMNLTFYKSNELLVSGYADMEIKHIRMDRKKMEKL